MNLPKITGLMDLVPSDFCLSQNYPNPFNDKTTIKFCLAYRTRVELEVFNAEGTIVKNLLDEEKDAGTYEIEFSAGGDVCEMPEGIYAYSLRAGDFSESKKMTVQGARGPARGPEPFDIIRAPSPSRGVAEPESTDPPPLLSSGSG